MDDVEQDDTERAEPIERPDPARMRYWARLIKLLRNPFPPRSIMPTRSHEPPRLPEPPRQPMPARLGDDA
jgi:hypothetical protein